MWQKNSKVILALLFVALLLASGCAGKKTEPQGTQTIPAGSAYAYKPDIKDIGEGWQLVWEAKNLVGWPLEQQKTFATDGIADSAGWKYLRGNETLHIWARNFNSLDELVKVESEKVSVSPYKGSIYWKDVSELPQYGEMARIGVFSAANDKENTNLFLYVAQNKTMFFIQYTNQQFNGHERYEKIKLFDDKRFLIGLFKKISAKSAATL